MTYPTAPINDTLTQPTEIQQEEPPMTTHIHRLDEPDKILYTIEGPTNYHVFENVDLTGANFDGLNLTSATFSGCTLDNASFYGANLSNAQFRNQSLLGINFDNAILKSANFIRADVHDCSFHGAQLQAAHFDRADLEGTSFVGASLDWSYFYETTSLRDVDWPSTGWASLDRWWHQRVYGLEFCGQCSTIMLSDEGCTTEDEGFVCSDCGYEECYECGEFYFYIDSHNEEYHGESDDDSCDCGCCDSSSSGNIRNYSYKPFWSNHGISSVKFGFELELSGPRGAAAHVLESNPAEDVLICKDDSSIRNGGFEIVSHPMDLDWFNANFDHNLLPKLREAGMTTYDDTGLHVHVSRKSFSTNFHRLTWLNLIYMNADPLTKFARRTSNEWARFNKPQKGELPAKAKEAGYQWVRYQAVNCQNESTFEMRFFRSTLNRVKLRAALEFADASIEYTRHVKSRDVLKGGALTWNHFYEWVITNPDRYRYLQNQMETLTDDWLVDGAVANTSLSGGF